MTDFSSIEAGDELTFDLEGEMDGVADKEMTLEIARIDDGKLYVEDDDGTEFGYIKEAKYVADEDAQLRHVSGQLMGRCNDVTVEGREEEMEIDELENDLDAKKEARDAMEEAGREENVERLEGEIAELEEELADLRDDEPEIVTDGGEDVTEHVDDETIEDAIDRHDDRDHEDATTVEEVRDALAWLQQSIEEVWDNWMYNIRTGDATVVYEDDELIVLTTHKIDVVRRDLREFYDVDLDDTTLAVISAVTHQLARDLCDYDWSYEYPLVMRKPHGMQGGEEYVEALINSLLERGLSPAEAWAYYGVEILGNSQSDWARRGGKDQSTISKSLQRAHRKLP